MNSIERITNILLLISLSFCCIVCYKERNILFNQFKDKSKSLDDINLWRNKLRDDFKQNLLKLPENVKKAFIENADQVLKKGWEPLLVTDYLDFITEGKDSDYSNKNSERRKRLEALVLAEVLTNKGKYLNEVANGIWFILEESSWTYPAHLKLQKAGYGLPDPDQFIMDLGQGDTSAYVAWINFLLGDKLSKLSPMFNKRIDYELNRRIIEPYLINDFKWPWMETKGGTANNWNIWINNNLLMTALLNDNNITERHQLIDKILKSVDDWINWYGDDGGCNEGPTYWNHAAGHLIQFLYYLLSASNQQLDGSSNQLINNMGSYIYKMHIDRDYFVNFADASPKQIPNPTFIYRYGQMFNNSLMKEFASFFYQMAGNESVLINDDRSGNLHNFYLQMITYSGLKSTAPKTPQPLESWFPDIQVVTVRKEAGSAKGLFLGAKAGTNGESHNHNDVGNFVLYVNGMPAIIDVGPGVYIAKTFTPKRYEIWNLQSQWHNTPTINGIQQHDGVNYAAVNVSYTNSSIGGEFVADISGAYPKEAYVKSWVRKLIFNRNQNTLNLSETYSLEKFVESFKIHLITILNVTYQPNSGEIVLKNQNIKLDINFDKNLLDVQIDEHKTDDQTLAHNWGDRVIRVSLVAKTKDLVGKHSVLFRL